MTTEHDITPKEYTSQSQQPREVNLLKIGLLFIGLGISAYITYTVSRSIMREISANFE